MINVKVGDRVVSLGQNRGPHFTHVTKVGPKWITCGAFRYRRTTGAGETDGCIVTVESHEATARLEKAKSELARHGLQVNHGCRLTADQLERALAALEAK